MLPRKSSISRCLALVALVVFCCWMWLSADRQTRSDLRLDGESLRVLHMLQPQGQQEAKSAGRTAHPVLNNTHSHRHSNVTLEDLRKNMTILKANMSGVNVIVNQIIQAANKSHNVTGVRHPVPVIVPEEHNAINPHPFQYILNGQSVCKDSDVFLVVYVHTAPSHYKRRMVIRQTWGSAKYYLPETIVRLVFIMGKTQEKPEVQQALAFESEQYGDIVQEDFEDTYKNLTYKGVAGLKWVFNYCSHSRFVLKTDDDIFVNMFTLLRHLHSLDKFGTSNTNLLMCLVWTRMKVMRTGKWKVDESEFKDTHYPTYCSGSAFTMSTDVAIAMYKISYQVPFFWVDDFYITGLLPLKLGTVKHKQFMSTYVLDGRKLEEKFTGSQWFTYIFSHVHDLNKIQSVWETLVKLNKGTKSAKVKYVLPAAADNKPK